MLILRPQFLRRTHKKPLVARHVAAPRPASSVEEQLGILLAHFHYQGSMRRKAQGQFRYFTWLALTLVGYAWLNDLMTGEYSIDWIVSHWLIYIIVLIPACAPLGVSHFEREIAQNMTRYNSPRIVGPLLQAREFGDAELCKRVDKALLRIMGLPMAKWVELSSLERRSLHKALHDGSLELVEAILPLAVSQGDRETLQTLSRLTTELFLPQQTQLKFAVKQALEQLTQRLEQESQPEYLLRATAPYEPPQSLLRPAKDIVEPTFLLRSLSEPNNTHFDPIDETIQNVGTSNF